MQVVVKLKEKINQKEDEMRVKSFLIKKKTYQLSINSAELCKILLHELASYKQGQTVHKIAIEKKCADRQIDKQTNKRDI